MEVEIEMPETSGEVETNFEISKEELKRILQLKKGETMKFSGGTVTCTENGFEFSSTQEVTLEFDMGDYAPERDESRD